MVEPRHSFRYEVALITLGLVAYALASGKRSGKPAREETPNKSFQADFQARGSESACAATPHGRHFPAHFAGGRGPQLPRSVAACARSDACRGCVCGNPIPKKREPCFGVRGKAAVTADKEAWRRYAEERKRIQGTSESNRYVQSPPELRSEVMRLIAKRDRALAEEFLEQLTEDTVRDTNPASGNLNPATPQTLDPENPPLAIVQRLQLAMQLLEDGDIARALQFADPALDRVTTRGVFFLSYLREKDMAAADQRFATMLARTVADPSSDAVGVSVLSSYVFTPFLYIIVRGKGQNHTSQSRENMFLPLTSRLTCDALF